MNKKTRKNKKYKEVKQVRGLALGPRDHCVFCGNRLTSELSKFYGYGPKCGRTASQGWLKTTFGSPDDINNPFNSGIIVVSRKDGKWSANIPLEPYERDDWRVLSQGGLKIARKIIRLLYGPRATRFVYHFLNAFGDRMKASDTTLSLPLEEIDRWFESAVGSEHQTTLEEIDHG